MAHILNSYQSLWRNLICCIISFYIPISMACANNSMYNIENNIGLYEIIDKKCEVIKNSFSPCKTTLYLEIVKGQFFGISNSSVGLVFWTGDSKIEPELQYTAQLISNHANARLSGDRVWLTDEKKHRNTSC